MKSKSFICMLTGLFLIGLVGTAQATIIFSDNFNAENGGVGVVNYSGFANWTVSAGTVDLIGNGYYDFLPGNGLYVDMDGSTGNAGIMTNNLSLAAGNYVLSYNLAGNQLNGSTEQVDVQVALGSLVNATHSLNQNDPFTTFIQSFTVSSPTIADLSFIGNGGDNIGMLLDNIVLEQVVPVPEPSTLLLLGAGLGGLVFWRKKRQ